MALHSIDALLDAEADAAVRAEWAQLSAAGLPSRADHRGASNAPHLTLVSARMLPGESDEALGRLLAGLLPVRLRLGALLVLGDRRHALARRVERTRALLALHHGIVHALPDDVGLSAEVQPGSWVPHVTLASRLDDEQLEAACVVLAGRPGIDARVTTVQRWDPGTKTVHPLVP